METRPEPLIKFHSLQRYVIWKHLQPVFNNIRVVEFPKSGGTWLCQMLADLMDLPFPRNSALPFRRAIQHAHHIGPTSYKTIVLIRDGRDVITSAYFHFLMSGERKHGQLVKKWRGLLGDQNFTDIKKTMPLFINAFHNSFSVGGKNINWGQHVVSYDPNDDNLIFVKYENLLENSELELKRILDWYKIEAKKDISSIVDKHSFKNQTGRNRGEEQANSFLRKGVAGDWKNNFNEQSIQLCEEYYGHTLRRFDYV